MEIQINANQGAALIGPVAQPAPPPAQPDGRASADVAASIKDPTPEVPLPFPASPSQTGLVSKASIASKDEATKADAPGPSSAERMLKPYGINMLPEKQDAAAQNGTPDAPE